jgi:hypothetical protein
VGLFNLRWSWNNDVPEADIDLHRNSRFGEHRVKLDSNTLVIRVLLDSANLDRSAIEFDAVRFSDYVAHRAYEFRDVVQLVTCPSGEIDVDRWPGDGRPPSCEKKRTLEDESIREWGLRQPEQESLHCKVLEKFLERTALCT